MTFKVPERFRITIAKKSDFPGMPEHMFSDSRYGNNGVFYFEYTDIVHIRCIVSDQEGWEHVSVSVNHKRCPTWEEMCFIKNQFWSESDCVVQFHPPKSEYVNCHKYCLHLWRQTGTNWATPPKEYVG